MIGDHSLILALVRTSVEPLSGAVPPQVEDSASEWPELGVL